MFMLLYFFRKGVQNYAYNDWQKAIATSETVLRAKKVFAIYSEKLMTSYFNLRFFGVLRFVEDNYWHIWNLEKILSRKQVF